MFRILTDGRSFNLLWLIYSSDRGIYSHSVQGCGVDASFGATEASRDTLNVDEHREGCKVRRSSEAKLAVQRKGKRYG